MHEISCMKLWPRSSRPRVLQRRAACRPAVAVGLERRQLFAEETTVRWREPSRLPATATVRPRDDLQQVAARVLKIDAASAVVTVDLTCLGLRGVGPMRQALILHAGQNLVEFSFAHQERIVLLPDFVLLVHEIDVHVVGCGDDLKRAPFLRSREPKYARQKRR